MKNNKAEIAKSMLIDDVRCVIIGQNKTFISKSKGIAPLLEAFESGEYTDCVAADKIVGKAAALIYAEMGATEVYGKTLSESAAKVFDRFGIKYSYDILTKFIRNRQGDGICPMEMTVEKIDDPREAIAALKHKLNSLNS